MIDVWHSSTSYLDAAFDEVGPPLDTASMRTYSYLLRYCDLDRVYVATGALQLECRNDHATTPPDLYSVTLGMLYSAVVTKHESRPHLGGAVGKDGPLPTVPTPVRWSSGRLTAWHCNPVCPRSWHPRSNRRYLHRLLSEDICTPLCYLRHKPLVGTRFRSSVIETGSLLWYHY
jgi:hypothetical protein